MQVHNLRLKEMVKEIAQNEFDHLFVFLIRKKGKNGAQGYIERASDIFILNVILWKGKEYNNVIFWKGEKDQEYNAAMLHVAKTLHKGKDKSKRFRLLEFAEFCPFGFKRRKVCL